MKKITIESEIKKEYRVINNIKETAHVSTLSLALVDSIENNASENESAPPYHSGQFITVYFPELGTPAGKAYSISSPSYEPFLNITVKAIGPFSNRLAGLKRGDTLIASLPYGFFYSESTSSCLRLIAAGIGVAPFHSIILESLRKNPLRDIQLFYSVKKNEDIIFQREFADLEVKYDNFFVFYFITQEAPAILPRMSAGRINLENIITKSEEDAEYMICGSITFVRDLWRGLKSKGVADVSIYTEAFFSH